MMDVSMMSIRTEADAQKFEACIVAYQSLSICKYEKLFDNTLNNFFDSTLINLFKNLMSDSNSEAVLLPVNFGIVSKSDSPFNKDKLILYIFESKTSVKSVITLSDAELAKNCYKMRMVTPGEVDKLQQAYSRIFNKITCPFGTFVSTFDGYFSNGHDLSSLGSYKIDELAWKKFSKRSQGHQKHCHNRILFTLGRHDRDSLISRLPKEIVANILSIRTDALKFIRK